MHSKHRNLKTVVV